MRNGVGVGAGVDIVYCWMDTIAYPPHPVSFPLLSYSSFDIATDPIDVHARLTLGPTHGHVPAAAVYDIELSASRLLLVS